MRILYVASRKYDYLQDLTYAGLAQEYGKARVLDWPRRAGFHLPLKRYPIGLGYVAGLPPLLQHPATFDAEALVLASCKPDAVERYLRLLPSWPDDQPTAWIDGGDREELGGDLDRLGRRDLLDRLASARPFDAVLKRELIEGDGEAYDRARLLPGGWPALEPRRVVPFPLAVRSDLMPAPAKDLAYDVTFWASTSHEDRRAAFRMLAGRYDCDANGSTPHRTLRDFARKGDAYLRELSRARISLNVRGGGWDTLRLWEMLAMGTAVLSQRLPLVIPQPPTDGAELAWVREDLADLHERIGYFLTHEEERAAMARAGRAWVLAHHDHRARAQQLVAALRA